MTAATKLRERLRRKAPQAVLPARHATSPEERRELAPRWARGELVGRLTEISSTEGGSALTVATGLVLSAQCDGEPVVWIAPPERLFYPPDLAASGVDLEALAVVRIAGGAPPLARACDKLLRSGAFGLLVVDLGRDDSISQALQSRLVGLAQKHETAVVLLTEKTPQHASVGSLVSLRAQTKRVRLGTGRFACDLEIVKDKRRGPGWTHRELCRGPVGLR